MSNGFELTTIEAVQAQTLANTKNTVFKSNVALRDGYLNTTFAKFAESVKEGRDPGTNPPQPPFAWEVAYFTDELTGPGTPTPNVVQWAFPRVSTTPVCEIPPIPIPVPVQQDWWKIGAAIPGGGGVWFVALVGDVTPAGAIQPGISADGVHGLFEKYSAPVGGGWFRRIG